MLDFNPARPSSPPRDAASVLVLRENDSTGALEIFCVKRHPRSGFLGGAVVFPGGKVDEADADPFWESLSTAPHPRSQAFETPGRSARMLAIAACRELLEEAAVLPTVGDLLDARGANALQAELRDGKSLHEELQKLNASLDLSRLAPFARWITPEAESRRFDARFYLLALPPGQKGRHDSHETTTSFWAAPDDVLSRFLEGELMLTPPTTRALEVLAQAKTMSDAMALAEAQSLLPICPVFVADEEAPFLALPGDPMHPVEQIRVEGATRFVLRDGRFISEEPKS